DRGNLTTTVNNFGYVGGYSSIGRPSGRWPANSTHDYLAEMKFWIGGVNAAGDTLLADTDEDFNPLPNWAAAATPTDILLSTDTTRYPYDPTDTVGLGIGFPAYGWQVWDVAGAQWAYNQVYHTLSASFYPGGPVGVQESICRYGDDALGSPVMGLEVTQTVRQWNYTEIKDFIIFTLEITNASTQDYHDVALGIYCDYDVGGNDAATGENGRLGDLVAIDTALNLAWTYDEDGYDPGWGPGVETGFMGTVLLSTPNDVGMTSFNTGQWEFLPTTDLERYEMITNDDFDESLPPTDQYYVQAVKGIDLLAGQTFRVDFALVAAPNADLLKQVADRAKTLYTNKFIASRPPDPAVLRATAGNHKIILKWDDTAEKSVDPASGVADFEGYKVFRSTDQGNTWGTLKINSDYSVGPDYVPLKLYLSDDFGRIAHTFSEANLVNGQEYWYAVVAFDSSGQELDFTSGSPNNSTNIVRVFPRSDPLGYQSPQGSIQHVYTGTWEASFDSVEVYIVDEAAVTGDEYKVTFSPDCFPTWNLIDVTTGDTVLAAQDQLEGDAGTYPVADGLQIVVTNPRLVDTFYQSGFAVAGLTTLEPLFLEEFYSGYGCNDNFRNDIEIRFTATGSVAYDWFSDNPVTVPFEVWNTVTNTQVGCWIADFWGDGEWTQTDTDYVILTNYDYDGGNFHPEVLAEYLTWVAAFDVQQIPTTGDILRINGPRLMSPDDEFAFSSHKIVGSEASRDIDKIRVVPNPYLGEASWESSEGQRKLQFVNLPDQCSIRIYTLAGELIRTLDHTNGTGTEDWNMLSESNRGIASGVYLFSVESDYGNYTGKFAVIK
ncbi:MAG: T9SS type A sorting domain-containing protein, partial [candidate division Zixibacteria bacterium]|nr:T9SS type A sorting domain-containing protein [candidate division Zixibacteria bacterium]